MSYPARQMGLSIVELMVALAISSFLILGVTQIYIDNKRSYSFQNSQAHNQENSRYTELVLTDWLNPALFTKHQNSAVFLLTEARSRVFNQQKPLGLCGYL